MAQVFGLLAMSWFGQDIEIEEGGTVKVGGLEGKPVVAGRNVHQAQAVVASEVKATVPIKEGQSLKGLYDTRIGELQCRLDTGQTVTWHSAFMGARPTATAGDGGKAELTWHGGEPDEVIS